MKRKYRIFLSCCLLATLVLAAVLYIEYVDHSIPDNLYLDSNSDGSINVNLPFWGTIDGEKKDGESIEASVNLMEPVTINSGECARYKLSVKLLGLIKVKEINVTVDNTKSVTACGIPVGIYINTDGILVVDIGEINGADGTIAAPSRGILNVGDYIDTVNDREVATKDDLVNAIEGSNGDYVVLGIRRNDEPIEVKLKPVMDSSGVYKIGAWVRDDCQGLGTLTYVSDSGRFGALGHAISDGQTGEMVEIQSGKLYTARVWSVVKGTEGTPGEVIGSINYGDSSFLGIITDNTPVGIYGNCDDNIYAYVDKVYMNVAYKQDIEKGRAYIRTYVGGGVKDYEINIEEIHYQDEYENKGIVFEVTDKELLEETNGIVQGMSGSPIIQNGKFIGAVTHVFVNEPGKGYGIFAEKMLEQG